MAVTNKKISKRQTFQRIFIVFGVLMAAIVAYVFAFVYKPAQNSLEALASVCMDVISMIVLTMLIVLIAFEEGQISRTTKLFLGLMVATLIAQFLDFLVWSFDGMLSYNDITFFFIISSLCMGALLAAVLVVYLSSYMDDMYGMAGAFVRAKVCVVCNLVAFVITVTLGLTHYAFVVDDGHYRTGALYDVITVIPVLTLLYMCAYAFHNIKIIGIHDIIAVTGYILIMICGAMVEAAVGVGSTYVSLMIADIYIYYMLQNKLIDRVRKQREQLAEQITSQYEILDSMAGIYSYVNYIDLDSKTVQRFDQKTDYVEKLEITDDTHTGLNTGLYDGIVDEHKDKFWEFTRLNTLPARMASDKIITGEFRHKEEGWIRTQYIRIGEATDGPVTRVIYSIQNIDEEKKNVEKWIQKSNTDELTGFYNRHAYEEDIAILDATKRKANFVYISVDVNSLKVANDTLGHVAGDELILGACECMKRCFGSYGKLYRTGGDEFVAMIYVDESRLIEIKQDIVQVTEAWRGTYNMNLAISCGYVTQKEAGNMPISDIEILADKRMYEDKRNYYMKKGVDRRVNLGKNI